MRKDFSKLLTEQPRYGSDRSFREARHSKKFKSFEEGGREGMRFRYNPYYDERKFFGEFLAPLERYLKKQAGRKWDDVYGEIRKNFDVRKVTNQHIFEHIYDFIEVKNLFYEDGVLYVRNAARPSEPLSVACQWKYAPDLYVDPKDGIIKATKRRPKAAEVYEPTYIKISQYEDLVKVDGNWFVFTWEPCDTELLCVRTKPNGEKVYAKRRHVDMFTGLEVSFDTVYVLSHTSKALNELKGLNYSAAKHRPGFYRAKKRTASSKEIKKFVKDKNEHSQIVKQR